VIAEVIGRGCLSLQNLPFVNTEIHHSATYTDFVLARRIAIWISEEHVAQEMAGIDHKMAQKLPVTEFRALSIAIPVTSHGGL
jgi:hypothetical protein